MEMNGHVEVNLHTVVREVSREKVTFKLRPGG